MAKYQRNLALSLVRTRNAQITPLKPTMGTVPETETFSSEKAAATAATAAAAAASALPPPPPLPLLRDEIAGLRGGTTREGRRLEDWHPESLVALWCTSLMLGRDDGKGSPRSVGSMNDGGSSGGGWERGRERILSILRWVSKDSEQEAEGGVMAGTVVPFLAHAGGRTGASAEGAVEGSLGKLKACFTAYLSDRLQVELGPEDEREGGGAGEGSLSSSSLNGPSVRRLPHASTRHFLKGAPARDATPATARDVADTAAAAGVPLRLLNLSGAELSALSALLDEALGQEIGPSASSFSQPAKSSTGGAAAGDTAAALFSSSKPSPLNPPSPSSPDLEGFRKALDEPTVAPAVQSNECASIFLLARGLRARLGRGGGGGVKGSEPGMASSAALAMLLAPSSTQKDVLEIVCPRNGGVGVAAGTAMNWGDARAMHLPLWVRDVSELQRVAEVVASNTFLQDKDIMAVRGVLAWSWSRRLC